MTNPAPTITIRSAIPDDAGAITALYRQLVGNPGIEVQPARIAALADDASTALLVAVCDEQVTGTALVCLCADVMFQSQPFAVVENIIVDAAHRGKGIGAALLHHIEAYCLRKDCSKIMLQSAAHRHGAHRLFERAGYDGACKRGFVKYRSAFTSGSDHAG